MDLNQKKKLIVYLKIPGNKIFVNNKLHGEVQNRHLVLSQAVPSDDPRESSRTWLNLDTNSIYPDDLCIININFRSVMNKRAEFLQIIDSKLLIPRNLTL